MKVTQVAAAQLGIELAANLKTAKALGLAIPSAIRLRVDRVIE